MKVPNILGGLGGLTAAAQGPESRIKATAARAAAAAKATEPPSNAAAMRAIVSQYDMTRITPDDFSSMIQQLSAAGAISSTDLQQLSSIRVDLEAADVSGDEATNLLAFYQQQIAGARTAPSTDPIAAQAKLASLVGRMAWVQKFAAVRQQGSVNAVA